MSWSELAPHATALPARSTSNVQLMKVTLFAASGAFLAASAFGQMPDSAQRILQQLNTEMAAARKRAALQLESVKQAEMRRGNLDGATAIQNKIVELNGGPVAPLGSATAPAKPVTKQIQIKANAKLGGEIGAVHAGQSITIKYVEGRWAMSGGLNRDPKEWVSPDENTYPSNDTALYAVIDGEAKKLADVPTGTKRKPFRHRFDKDYAQVILRIRDEDAADNPGAVIYEITLGQ